MKSGCRGSYCNKIAMGYFFGPSCSGATKIENNKLQVNRNHCLVCERSFGLLCCIFVIFLHLCFFFISARKYFPFCPPVTTAPIIHSTFLHLIPLTVFSHPVQSFSHFLCSLYSNCQQFFHYKNVIDRAE